MTWSTQALIVVFFCLLVEVSAQTDADSQIEQIRKTDSSDRISPGGSVTAVNAALSNFSNQDMKRLSRFTGITDLNLNRQLTLAELRTGAFRVDISLDRNKCLPLQCETQGQTNLNLQERQDALSAKTLRCLVISNLLRNSA